MGSFITIMLNRQLTIYSGDKGVAAASIISSISIIFLMPLIGINQGMQPILGYNYGSKKYLRVRKTVILGLLTSTVIATIGFIICIRYAMPFISLFNKSKSSLNEFVLNGLKISVFFMPLIGAQFVATNYFQAIGKYKHSLLLAVLKYGLFLLPLLILPRYFGVNGIWLSNPISDFAFFLISATFLWFEIKKPNCLCQKLIQKNNKYC
jgi:Na+-driven multidrug efflux pump